jgi:hypothetical protein
MSRAWLHAETVATSAARVGRRSCRICVVVVTTQGAIDADEDPAQLAFEIEAALFLANAQYVVSHSSQPIEHARRAIERRVGA